MKSLTWRSFLRIAMLSIDSQLGTSYSPFCVCVCVREGVQERERERGGRVIGGGENGEREKRNGRGRYHYMHCV